jgi:hypothetical protein
VSLTWQVWSVDCQDFKIHRTRPTSTRPLNHQIDTPKSETSKPKLEDPNHPVHQPSIHLSNGEIHLSFEVVDCLGRRWTISASLMGLVQAH